MNITKEQADKVIAALETTAFRQVDIPSREAAISIMRGLDDTEPVPKTWHKVGYYHKAETADECDFYFLDAINGDCPDCHPCYADTDALEKPSPQAAQTDEREAFKEWYDGTRHSPTYQETFGAGWQARAGRKG